MAEQHRASREVYLRRRVAVAVAAVVLLAGGAGVAARLGDGGPDSTSPTLDTRTLDTGTLGTGTLGTGTVATGSTLAGGPPPLAPPSSVGPVGAGPATSDAGSAPGGPAPATVPAGAHTTPAGVPSVDAKAWVVYDVSSQQWLAEQGADDPLPVGSVMKLLTAKVVMDQGDLSKVVTVGKLQLDPMESAIGLYQGEQLARDVLLRAMLIVSANDAARALAVDVGGSEDAFVDLMNQTARSIGLEHTVAANPVGLDATGAHSSARDVVRLAALLMQDESFRATVARTSANLHGQVFETTNDLLAGYPGADGIKTGHTTDAGYCLVGSATRDGRQIIVAVLGSSTAEARVAAASALLDWAFASG